MVARLRLKIKLAYAHHWHISLLIAARRARARVCVCVYRQQCIKLAAHRKAHLSIRMQKRISTLFGCHSSISLRRKIYRIVFILYANVHFYELFCSSFYSATQLRAVFRFISAISAISTQNLAHWNRQSSIDFGIFWIFQYLALDDAKVNSETCQECCSAAATADCLLTIIRECGRIRIACRWITKSAEVLYWPFKLRMEVIPHLQFTCVGSTQNQRK